MCRCRPPTPSRRNRDMQAAEETTVLSEEMVVFIRRHDEAIRYGFGELDAQAWAESQVDSGLLRRLMRDGCPPKLAAEILL